MRRLVAPTPAEPAVQVHRVRQGVRLQARAAEPRAHAHGRETVRVLGVQQMLHPGPPPEDARAAAHRREAVLVPALQPVLRAGGQLAPAPQDAHGRELVPVRVLRRVLRDGRRAQGPQAPAQGEQQTARRTGWRCGQQAGAQATTGQQGYDRHRDLSPSRRRRRCRRYGRREPHGTVHIGRRATVVAGRARFPATVSARVRAE